ncbi:MAG: ATP-binding protein [Ignavibacteriaceae bacterium]|nr:ATP-binding protein [Ignavibacteriaceae bacterium]
MKFELGPEIINAYKRLSYTPWYALAEFVDNSTQSFISDRKKLEVVFKAENKTLEVKIKVEPNRIIIEDNAMGMSEKELGEAIILGKPTEHSIGRSKYGLGLKTSACWFGNNWSVRTKKLGESFEHFIEIDVNKIASDERDIKNISHKKGKNEHYTIIEIWNLNRKIPGKTAGKIKDYLRSFYRFDFTDINLKLFYQDDPLIWDQAAIDKRLSKDRFGKCKKREFKFNIGKKKVSGWAGVLVVGSRRDAGFSLVIENRVIRGWPNGYRPETLFGSQEGGSNDLVNQRLTGEIVLEGFDISHTKDEVLFSDEELEIFNNKLSELLGDIRQEALTFRKKDVDLPNPNMDNDSAEALNEFEEEINSPEIKDIVEHFETPELEVIEKINRIIIKKVTSTTKEPDLNAKINNVEIKIFIPDDLSPNDPYVIVETTAKKEQIIVLINKNHPHWEELKNANSILNFFRHCTYDAVAEWKCYFKYGKIQPDTVKLLKDNLLRVPLEIKKSK